MRVLVAEDDLVHRRIIETALTNWGYRPEIYDNGNDAMGAIEGTDPPKLMILDWMMPGLDGLQICERLRAMVPTPVAYIIVLSAKERTEFVASALEAGADDYIQKPFAPRELDARLRAAARIIDLQTDLTKRVRELEAALDRVDRLEGLLPICSYCKKIRSDKNYWTQLERYFGERANVQFSHGICPTCFVEHVEPELV